MESETTRKSRELSTLIIRHPALGLTLGYLLVSLLGLSFEWALFRRFGVNFFYFAEVTDFLMGAFREPVTFVLSGTALAVGWLTWAIGRVERAWLARKGENVGRLLGAYRRFAASQLNRSAPVVFFLGYSVLFIWIHTEDRADELRQGSGRLVTVQHADAPAPQDLQILGTSSRFVSLFDVSSGHTIIVPLENIASIKVRAPVKSND